MGWPDKGLRTGQDPLRDQRRNCRDMGLCYGRVGGDGRRWRRADDEVLGPQFLDESIGYSRSVERRMAGVEVILECSDSESVEAPARIGGCIASHPLQFTLGGGNSRVNRGDRR